MERKERTRLVEDETTIYEIDMDCMECRENRDTEVSRQWGEWKNEQETKR